MATGADITADFGRRLRGNGRAAEAVGDVEYLGLAGTAAKYTWLYSKVRNGGDWDLKNNVYRPYRQNGVIVCGKAYSNDMPGNFHYGFVGTAASVSRAILLRAAGEAQRRAGTSRPEFWCTHGDDPTDAGFVELGIQLYKNVGSEVTETALKHVLAGFTPRICGPRS